jgi:hypothetical protein
MKDTIFIDLPSLLGVDNETYAAADSGDRQAQKKMLRTMWTREASPKALASTLPWTYWLLRMIGSGTQQTIADVFGVIDGQRKTGVITAAEADALDRLIEQFVGPGTVDDATASHVRRTFPSGNEQIVIELFLLHDRLASGDANVTLPEIQAGVQFSEELKSPDACVFFLGVFGQYLAQAGYLDEAIIAAEQALDGCETLVAADAEYTNRLGVSAILLRQLYTYSNNNLGVTLIDSKYQRAMDAYNASQK